MKPLMAGFSFFVLAIELKIIRIFFNYINCWKEKKKEFKKPRTSWTFLLLFVYSFDFKKNPFGVYYIKFSTTNLNNFV